MRFGCGCSGSAAGESDFPPPYVLEPPAEHKATVILLHGRGATAHEFADVLSKMKTSANITLFEHFPNIRWVFPTAQLRWSSARRKDMSQWFDVWSLKDQNRKQSVQIGGLGSAVKFLNDLVDKEIRRVGSPSKVVLGGVSQGQATALHVFLCGGRRLGGFLGASGWLPLANRIHRFSGSRPMTEVVGLLRKELRLKRLDSKREEHGDLLETPVFLGHGTFDAVVDVEMGRQARDVLGKDLKVKEIEWKEYRGADLNGHWIKEPEELDDIVNFIRNNLHC